MLPRWEGYDIAYEILSLYELNEAITLDMRKTSDWKDAARGLVYVSQVMMKEFVLTDHNKLLSKYP